jgi:galactokinase
MDLNISIEKLSEVYGKDNHMLERQYKRYSGLLSEYRSRFPTSLPHFFSTPGRTELGGNHTDHNRGRIIAAGINLDSVAAASAVREDIINVFSTGYAKPFTIDLGDLSPLTSERGTTAALIRGIAEGFQELGYRAGGFQACIESDVMVGSGLSSSASIEVLIGTIFNFLYNGGKIDPITLSKICQRAENEYFGKPCGLMDQITCAAGGIVTIDFIKPGNPVVETLKSDFSELGLALLVVDTGGSHADLMGEYASIPTEMRSVAALFGKEVCREIRGDEFFENIRRIRSGAGDRAFLRAFHFLEENERVLRQVAALRVGDIEGFLSLVRESGDSSYRWLQNCYPVTNPREQGIAVALALTERYLKGIGRGACRVHGGGFAGTIQSFLPSRSVQDYRQLMEKAFSPGCVKELNIRNCGTVQVF